MKAILTAGSSFPSAMLIRDAIEETVHRHYYVYKDANKVRNKGILFRYGNDAAVEGDTSFNSPLFISLSKNKMNFSLFCKENELYSPEYFTREVVPTEFPVVMRSTLTGYGGVGIHFARNIDEFNQTMCRTWHWTPFVRCQFELRMHLFNGEVNRIYKKEPIHEESEFPIRNSYNEYHYSLKNNDKYPKVLELGNRLGELFRPLGGKFAAVDLGWDAVNKKYFIFEINSAPGLNRTNAMEYAQFILNEGVG